MRDFSRGPCSLDRVTGFLDTTVAESLSNIYIYILQGVSEHLTQCAGVRATHIVAEKNFEGRRVFDDAADVHTNNFGISIVSFVRQIALYLHIGKKKKKTLTIAAGNHRLIDIFKSIGDARQ